MAYHSSTLLKTAAAAAHKTMPQGLLKTIARRKKEHTPCGTLPTCHEFAVPVAHFFVRVGLNPAPNGAKVQGVGFNP